MWRPLVPLAVSLVLAVNLWLKGDAADRRVALAVGALLGLVMAATFWAHRHPESGPARLLFRSRGPRTGVAGMTKPDLYQSALSFLRFGVVAAAISALVGYLFVSTRSATAHTVLLLLLPFAVFPAGIGIVGGAYLLVRAAFHQQDRRAG